MSDRRWRLVTFSLAVAAALSLTVPTVLAQASSDMRPGIVVTKTTTVNAQGNTVFTERIVRNGQLIKEEVTVTTPAGAVVSKTETVFDPATGQAVKRETVTVSGNTVTKTEQRLVNGQVVKQEIQTFIINNGQRVRVEREFQLVNGQLVEVKREQKFKEVEKIEGVKKEVKEVEKEEVAKKEIENKEVEKVEHEHENSSHDGDGHDGKGR
jgi:hypothetical protein